jgi:outer membrane immunogenic protein
MSRSRWFSGLRWSVWCTLGLILAAPAAYADGMARRAAPMEQPFSWTGFYVGGHAGLVTGDTQGSVPPFTTDYPVNGALYGGQIGYNWQHGLMVYGVEGSLSSSTVEGSTACVGGLTCSRDLDWLASVTGRVGYAMGRTLLYGMGGVAWSDVHTHVGIGSVPFLSGNATHTGWIAGFGFEYALSSHVSTRIEYAHIDLGSETHNLAFVGGGPTIADKVDLKLDTIRLGVNIKLY